MSIATARESLVTTLADAGYKVAGYGTPKMVTPIIILDEAEPFLQYGDVQARPDIMRINFNVMLFADNKNAEQATKTMDVMVQKAVFNLGEWTLTNLESHYKVRLVENGPTYLVSRLSVTKYETIGD